MKVELLKLKNAVIDRRKILIPIFGIMLILSGFWIYGASRPISENKEENVSIYTHIGSYSYTVPVTKENPLYPVGTTLQMGMPAYFFVVSPTINMSFTYRLETTYPADVSGKLQTIVVATAKDSSGTGGSGSEKLETGGGSSIDLDQSNDSGNAENIIWKKEFPLNSAENISTWSGSSVTKNFSLDVSQVKSMVKSVADQLNYTQDPTIEIVNRVSYTGKINGENVQGTKDFAIPLVIKETSYYQLPEKLDFRQDNNVTQYMSVKSDPSLSKFALPLSFFLLSLVLIGLTLTSVKMGRVEPEDIEKLEKGEKRSSFKDFISKGKFPENRNSLIKIEISSLQELVDTAADMNLRVIYDAEAETYFMISNGVIYIFLETSDKRAEE
jgi:hypothetical protein